MATDVTRYIAQFGRDAGDAIGRGISAGYRTGMRNRMIEQQRQDTMEERNRLAQAQQVEEQRLFLREGVQALQSVPEAQQPQVYAGWYNEAARRGYNLEGEPTPDQYGPAVLAQMRGAAGVAMPGAQEQQGPRFGTINPRDFTTESLARYQQSGDFRDLERFANQQFKMIRGADGRERLHILDPASGQYVLARGNIVDGELQPPVGDTRPTPAPQQAVRTTTSPTIREQAQARAAGASAGKSEVKKASAQPKVRSAALSAKAKIDRLSNLFDSVSSRVSYWTAGPGAALASIPASDARDLQADLDTIKANMGFSELQEMRDNSPTGGALGQVTEREIAFLQALVANLEQSQSPEQLRRNLATAKQSVIDSWGRIAAAYEQQYGEPLTRAPSGGGQDGQQKTNTVSWSDL